MIDRDIQGPSMDLCTVACIIGTSHPNQICTDNHSHHLACIELVDKASVDLGAIPPILTVASITKKSLLYAILEKRGRVIDFVLSLEGVRGRI